MAQRTFCFTIFLVYCGIAPLTFSQVAKDLVCQQCVGQSDLKSGAVTAKKIRSNSILTTKIKNGAVGTSKIRNRAVTRAKIAAGAIDSTKLSKGVRDKINEVGALTSSHASLASRISTIEDNSVSAADRFDYRYEQVSRRPGEVFAVGDREYEMAEFDVVSLKNHSIFSIKLPVHISHYHRETYPRYGLGIYISGESGWRGTPSNSSIDGYPAYISYSTSMDYASEAANIGSDLKSDFDADGPILRAGIHKTFMTVSKENTVVQCWSPSIDFGGLPDNLSNAVLSFLPSDMNVWFNDGTQWQNSVPISSEYSNLVNDCLNSDNYLRQRSSIETSIMVTASIHLDEDTYLNMSISHQFPIPSASVNDYDRSFGGEINLATEVPDPDGRHVERQKIWQLFNNVVITER